MIKDLFEEVEVDKLLKDNAPVVKKIIGGEIKGKKPPKADLKESITIPKNAEAISGSTVLKDTNVPQKVQDLVSVFLKEGFNITEHSGGIIKLVNKGSNDIQSIYVDYSGFDKDGSVDVYSAKQKRWMKFFLIGTLKLLWFAVIATLIGYRVYRNDKKGSDASKVNLGLSNYVDKMIDKVRV